jgi:hypothetical protein
MLKLTRRDFLAAGGSTLLSAFGGFNRANAAMIQPKSVSENIMYCTARIVGLDQSGNAIKTGTGFLYQFPIDNQKGFPVLVTNKHVTEGTALTTFVVHAISGDGEAPNDNKGVQASTKAWIPHQRGFDG